MSTNKEQYILIKVSMQAISCDSREFMPEENVVFFETNLIATNANSNVVCLAEYVTITDVATKPITKEEVKVLSDLKIATVFSNELLYIDAYTQEGYEKAQIARRNLILRSSIP